MSISGYILRKSQFVIIIVKPMDTVSAAHWLASEKRISKNKYLIYTAGTLSPRIEEGVGGGALVSSNVLTFDILFTSTTD
jgi:hypothetical protein